MVNSSWVQMGESSRSNGNGAPGAPIRYLSRLSIIESVEEAMANATLLDLLMDVVLVNGPNWSSSLLHSSSLVVRHYL